MIGVNGSIFVQMRVSIRTQAVQIVEIAQTARAVEPQRSEPQHEAEVRDQRLTNSEPQSLRRKGSGFPNIVPSIFPTDAHLLFNLW